MERSFQRTYSGAPWDEIGQCGFSSTARPDQSNQMSYIAELKRPLSRRAFSPESAAYLVNFNINRTFVLI